MPAEGDTPSMASLHLASRARSFLENLLPTRQRTRARKAVGRTEVERRLAEYLRVPGESELNQLRDQARSIAPILSLEAQLCCVPERVISPPRQRGPMPPANLTGRAALPV